MPLTIISFCDFTGNWSRPYAEAGYEVIRLDLKRAVDIRLWPHIGRPVHGILAAPPCTDFSRAGSLSWGRKGSAAVKDSLSIVDACLRAIAIYDPKWWALENPVGRLPRWLGPPNFIFHPWEYGDPYTKETCLWGRFKVPRKKPVMPQFSAFEYLDRLPMEGSRADKRSVTPEGFSQAFFDANP
jgi:hypothetical protein